MGNKRGYSVSDLFRLKSVSDPQVSPDGRRFAYTVTSIDEHSDSYHSAIWLADGSSEPRQLTHASGLNYQPRWSPDGQRIAFLSTRAHGPAQLYLMAARRFRLHVFHVRFSSLHGPRMDKR